MSFAFFNVPIAYQHAIYANNPLCIFINFTSFLTTHTNHYPPTTKLQIRQVVYKLSHSYNISPKYRLNKLFINILNIYVRFICEEI